MLKMNNFIFMLNNADIGQMIKLVNGYSLYTLQNTSVYIKYLSPNYPLAIIYFYQLIRLNTEFWNQIWFLLSTYYV